MDAAEGSLSQSLDLQLHKQSCPPTPELPSKVQKVSADFSHGLEVDADALPTDRSGCHQSQSPPRLNSLHGDDLKADPVPEGNGAVACETSTDRSAQRCKITDAKGHLEQSQVTSGPSVSFSADEMETVPIVEAKHELSNEGKASQSTDDLSAGENCAALDVDADDSGKVSGSETISEGTDVEPESRSGSETVVPKTEDRTKLEGRQSLTEPDVLLTLKANAGTDVQGSSYEWKRDKYRGGSQMDGFPVETAAILDGSKEESIIAGLPGCGVSTKPADESQAGTRSTLDCPGNLKESEVPLLATETETECVFSAGVTLYDSNAEAKSWGNKRAGFCCLNVDRTGSVNVFVTPGEERPTLDRPGDNRVILDRRVTASTRFVPLFERAFGWCDPASSKPYAMQFHSVEQAFGFKRNVDRARASAQIPSVATTVARQGGGKTQPPLFSRWKKRFEVTKFAGKQTGPLSTLGAPKGDLGSTLGGDRSVSSFASLAAASKRGPDPTGTQKPPAVPVFYFSEREPPKPPAEGDSNLLLPTTGFNFSLASRKTAPKPIKNLPKGWKARSRVARCREPPPPPSELETSLLRSLECPVCLEPSTAPIYTCAEGHHVCWACRPRIRACGVCKAPLTYTRNWLAEDVSAKIVKVPCKNSKMGCMHRLLVRDMSAHVSACAYSVRCPCGGAGPPCAWRGPLSELGTHATGTHPVCVDAETQALRITPGGSSEPLLIVAQGAAFHCLMERCQGGWLPLCRRLGGNKPATCEFRLFATHADGKASGFRITYANRALAFLEDVGKVATLVVNADLVDRLVQSGQKVFFTARVLG